MENINQTIIYKDIEETHTPIEEMDEEKRFNERHRNYDYEEDEDDYYIGGNDDYIEQ